MDSPVPNLDQLGRKAEQPLLGSLRREVASLLGRDNYNFPGAQPVSFARHHLRDLKTRDYFLCEKSDGIRCLLYFTKDDPAHGETELHYLIDRKNNYVHIPNLHFPRPGATRADQPNWASYHIDSLLDGELLWDQEPLKDAEGQTMRDATGKTLTRRVLKYLVFDCMVLDGQNLCSFTLDKRLAYFHEGILEPYIALCRAFPEDVKRFPFTIEKKDVQRGYGTDMMFREILPKLKHGSDGLIFTCRETPYKFGTDENIVKWKPVLENSIDFKLDLRFPPAEGLVNGRINGTYGAQQEDEAMELDYDALPTCQLLIYCGDDRDQQYGTMHITSTEWEAMKKWAIEHDDGLDGQVVECHKDTEGRWRFGRFRDDKMEANHISVAEKVLLSIDDGVTEKDLSQAAFDIRQGWKERERKIDAEKTKRMQREQAL